mgnify:CR=1 FL=1
MGLLTIGHGFRMLRLLVSMAPLLFMAALLWAHGSSKSYYNGVWAQASGSGGFYGTTCPNVEAIARSSLQSQFQRDSTAPAAMLRLLFHDCQVNVSISVSVSVSLQYVLICTYHRFCLLSWILCLKFWPFSFCINSMFAPRPLNSHLITFLTLLPTCNALIPLVLLHPNICALP